MNFSHATPLNSFTCEHGSLAVKALSELLLNLWDTMRYGIFQDIEGLSEKLVEINVEIQDMKNFQDMETFWDMEIFLDMEAKHHIILHRTTIGRIKQSYSQLYSLYAYTLH